MNRSFFSRSRLLGLIAGLALIGAALPATTLAQDARAGVNIIEPSATDIMGWGVDNPNLSIPAGPNSHLDQHRPDPHGFR